MRLPESPAKRWITRKFLPLARIRPDASERFFMTSSPLRERVAAWIDTDPNPATQSELRELLADDATEELSDRFSAPLTFGTAGLRGPVRAGPNGMNVATVTRTTYAVGRWLAAHDHDGGIVVVGRDARTGSADFFAATTEVLAAQGFDVVALPDSSPTPLVSYATRALGAVAGIQITASHNPAADNGYKLYGSGGRQIVGPDDAQIEQLISAAPDANAIARQSVSPDDRARRARSDYLARVASLATPSSVPLRIALTPMHGVGGAIAVEALAAAGFDDVHIVNEQFAPDPQFPTVTFPNPEEPGATDLLIARAIEVYADIAIALDPDADRMAVGVPTSDDPTGWRMLSGDETGALLAAYLLGRDSAASKTVASSIVSGTFAEQIAIDAGARSSRTLTGFKWLSRADDDTGDSPLTYAYEEAIGHCVDPDAVRDKDGISAGVVLSSLARELKATGQTLLDRLDYLERQHGVHVTTAGSRRLPTQTELDAVMATLRADPPRSIAGIAVGYSDFATRTDGLRTDAVELNGVSEAGLSLRIMVRPSGTEPKIKYYVETTLPADRYGDTNSLVASRQAARDVANAAVVALTEGGPS